MQVPGPPLPVKTTMLGQRVARMFRFNKRLAILRNIVNRRIAKTTPCVYFLRGLFILKSHEDDYNSHYLLISTCKHISTITPSKIYRRKFLTTAEECQFFPESNFQKINQYLKKKQKNFLPFFKRYFWATSKKDQFNKTLLLSNTRIENDLCALQI